MMSSRFRRYLLLCHRMRSGAATGAATIVKFVESGFEGRQSSSRQAPCPSSGRSPLNAPTEPGQTQSFEQNPHAVGDVRFTVAGVMPKKARRSLSVWLEFVPSLAGCARWFLRGLPF
jgi:hypothetical protein